MNTKKIKKKNKKTLKNNQIKKISPELLKKYKTLSPFELKDKLASLAGKNASKFNAGRGNPNFLNSFVRSFFGELQNIVLEKSKKFGVDQVIFPDESKYNYKQLFMKSMGKLNEKQKIFFKKYLNYLSKRAKQSKKSENQIIYDLFLSTLGCYYPVPPQIQPHLELIAEEYLYDMVMSSSDGTEMGSKMKPNDFECFATEGAAAGILYVFNTLKENYLLKEGDTIALITPIFSPYLEMPKLSDYKLNVVELKGDVNNNWSLNDAEINKLNDKKIKALFMVNPSNPGAFSLSKDNINKIGKIVNTTRQDLIVLSDSVYAPFTNEYNSFMLTCPKNTIEIFSLSKYFGTTGWRLGLCMIAKNNRFNLLLNKLSPINKNKLKDRYEIASISPDKLTFMDRLVFDSRQVAEGHVGGLSTPQQVLIGLFLFYDMIDMKENNSNYRNNIKSILKHRLLNLYEPLKTEPIIASTSTDYYTLMDIPTITTNLFGENAKNKLLKNYSYIDFLFILASKYKTQLLPGGGFGASEWMVRASLANLTADSYTKIGENIKKTIEDMVK